MLGFFYGNRLIVVINSTDTKTAKIAAAAIAADKYREVGLTETPSLSGVAALPLDGVITAWNNEPLPTGKPLLAVTAAARRNDRSKIYLTVDTNYGGIITPDGTARLLPCEVCEQCFWVPVNTVSMTCDPCATGPFTVGRSDTTGKITRHATLAEAEARIAEIEQTDPAGVHAGDYYIDGPEELINPPARSFTGHGSDGFDINALPESAEIVSDEDDEPEDSPTCPICEGPGVPLGSLGSRAHYRCRNCGMAEWTSATTQPSNQPGGPVPPHHTTTRLQERTMLVFESLTPQELLKEIAEYLRQQAARYTQAASHARTQRDKGLDTARANTLLLAAIDLEGAGIIPANPVFRMPAGELIASTPAEADKDELEPEA